MGTNMSKKHEKLDWLPSMVSLCSSYMGFAVLYVFCIGCIIIL